MTTKTKEISTRVTEDVKAIFIDIANNKGLTESELLRLIISDTINNQESKKTTPKKEMLYFSHMRKTEDELKITRLEIHMPKFLVDEVKEKAKNQGMATRRWLKSLVQSNLIHQPVLTDSAVDAIRESNREIAAIGNNINQIARKLNESVFNADMVKIKKLEEIDFAIDSLRAELKNLVKVSRDGWGL